MNKPINQFEGKIAVHLDKKTAIYVKEGADIESIKEKYLKNLSKF
jgi:hypothetical protein